MRNPTVTHPIKRRPAVWLAWGLCALVAAATVYTIGDALLYYASESGPLGTLAYILDALLPLACAVLASLIVLRQPGNAIGWLLFGPACAALVDVVGSVTVQKLAAPPPDPSPLFLFALWLDGANWILFVFPILLILALFPTGRPPSPRWNWVVVLALGMVAFDLSLTTFAQYWESPNTTEAWRVVNPFGFIPNEVLDAVFDAPWFIALVVLMVSSEAALVWRYRRSSFVERTQIKWPLFASAIFGVVYVMYVAVVSLTQLDVTQFAEDLASLLLSLASLAVPFAIGVAILRYHLWDIDVIIRRTLVYGVLTALLALLFFGGVTALQVLFGSALGRSQIGTVGATLAVAVVALPLRNRIQAAIDRRFYRQKYDAQRTLEAFMTRLRDEANLNDLASDLTGVIHETMQPAHVRVWLMTTPLSAGERGSQAEGVKP